MQDALVYASPVPEKACEQYATLSPTLQALLPAPELNAPFSSWTCQCAETLEKKILNKENILFIDINSCYYTVFAQNNNPTRSSYSAHII